LPLYDIRPERSEQKSEGLSFIAPLVEVKNENV
jgi:hypothetical protein